MLLSQKWTAIEERGADEMKRIVFEAIRKMDRNGFGPSAQRFNDEREKLGYEYLPNALTLIKRLGYSGNGGWPGLVEDAGLKRAGNKRNRT